MVAKKFSDCTIGDLRSATKHRKEGHKVAGKVIRGPANKAEDAPKLPKPALWRALAMIVLGAVAGLVADLLQPFLVGAIVGVLALILTFGGMADLVRYFVSIRDRIIAGFKSGAGLRVINDEWMEVVQSGRKLVAILFETKDALVNVLFREIQLGLADAVMAGFPRRSTVRQRMEHVWTAYVRWGVENPVARQALKQLHMSSAITDETRAAGAAYLVEVERLRKDAVEQRILRDPPPELVAGTLKALAEMTMDLIAKKAKEAPRYQALGFEMFWVALTKRPRGAR